jgi:LysM repeat protein
MMKKIGSLGVTAAAVLLAGCTISYSNPPTGSPKSDGTSGFSSTSPAVATMNAMRTAFIQQTLRAGGQVETPTAAATNTSSFSTVAVTPAAETAVAASNTPASTPTVSAQSTAAPVVPTSTPGLPATYKIHEGETIWCLGRRFDINPADIIAANGNVSEVYPDDVIKIPQNGDPFPGERTWHTHTANMTYTVTAEYNTVYKIGCYFGDVDPNRIIAANNLKDPFTLIVGQKIVIP